MNGGDSRSFPSHELNVHGMCWPCLWQQKADPQVTADDPRFPTKIQFFQPNAKLIGNFVQTIFFKKLNYCGRQTLIKV